MNTTPLCFPLFVVASLLATPASLRAASDPSAVPQVQAQAESPPADLEKPIYGFYLSMRPFIGYDITDPKITNPGPGYPNLAGQPDCVGNVGGVDVNVGYDLSTTVGLHLVAGMAAGAGCRGDRVRGLNIAFGGIGARIRLPLSERLFIAIAPQVAIAQLDNRIETATTGALLGLSAGIEYFAHVRHVSVGVELGLLAPLAPFRTIIGLVPHVRYTF